MTKSATVIQIEPQSACARAVLDACERTGLKAATAAALRLSKEAYFVCASRVLHSSFSARAGGTERRQLKADCTYHEPEVCCNGRLLGHAPCCRFAAPLLNLILRTDHILV